MSNNIGSASLLIVPTFDGLSSKVDAALGSASGTASKSGSKLGESTAGGFGKGLTASGAVIGAFSAITSSAMSSISAHVGDAVARFDTLNNYPKVMQSLGYSSESAESSISKMSDRLSTLPTRLDDMASTVQGIAAITGDLDQATDAGLALNDMLLASGSSTQLTNAAMEQFRQILSKGKPDMQDWKSLTSAMPGQMNQLAQAMLGPTANANDLYTALGGGGAEATVSMGDLLNKMIELDQTGGDSITSFKEQAETAAGGLQTSIDNMSNAVTKGLTGILDTIGKENIAGVFTDMKGAINDAFSAINGAVSGAMPYVRQFYDLFKSNSTTILTAVGTFSGLTVGADALRSSFGRLVNTNDQTRKGFETVKTGASDLVTAFSLMGDKSSGTKEKLTLLGDSAKTVGSGMKGVLSGLVASIDPVSLALTGLTAAISLGVAAYTDWKTKADNMTAATDGLNEAVQRSTSLDGYRGTIEGVGTASGNAAQSIDDLAASMAKSVDTIDANNQKAETTVATLNTAQRYIGDYAGKTDLTTEAQGKLQWAIDQVNDSLGTSITATDVANNSYDQNGEHVDNLKQKISELIEEKKREAKAEAITENLTELYSKRTEAAKTLASTEKQYSTVLQDKAKWMKDYMKTCGTDAVQAEQAYKVAVDYANQEVGKAQELYDSAADSCKDMENELGNAETATSALGDAMQAVGEHSTSAMELMEAAFDNNGQSISSFSEQIDALGVNTDQFAALSDSALTDIANSYDGSMASIAEALTRYEVGMGNSAAKTEELKTAIADTLANSEGMGDVFANLGWNADDFATACANAGLSAEDFNGMTSESFAQLAENCGGNMQDMIAQIASYNSTPLVDKDGNVNINDNTLVDAQGHVLTYNGTGLYDKTAGAYVDSASVVDSTGNVWTWDGTALVSKGADATITGNAVTGDATGKAKNTQKAIDNLKSKTKTAQVNGNASDGSAARNIWNTVSAIGSLVGKTITNTIRNITKNNARGGIRPHAAGGVRKHANGAIVNNYGAGVPLDIVGEDGAEAIVPLTNKRYVTPFARTVAEQMGEVGGSGTAEALERVIALLSAILDKDGDVYLDSDKVSAALAARGRYAMAGRGLA